MNRKNDKNKKGLDFSQMMYGYVLPHNEKIEMAVLGYMMKWKQGSEQVRQFLQPEDFYSTASQVVCRAAFALEESGVFPEEMMLLQYLKDQALLEVVGGPWFIVSCIDRGFDVNDIKVYSLVIKQASLQRSIIKLAQDMISSSMEGEDVFDVIKTFREQMDVITDYMASIEVTTLTKIAMETASHTIYRQSNENPILTGIEAWDELNGELFAGGVYVLAARPGMGKTAMVVQLIRNMAKKFPIGFVNIEMSDRQMCTRYCCNYADIDNDLLKVKPGQTGELSEDIAWQMKAALDDFIGIGENLQLLTQQSDVDNIIAKCSYWVRSKKVKVIILDYIQIVKVKDDLTKYMTEVQALNYIMLRLRDTAKRLEVPMILLSQLNREIYKRGGAKEPGLSDLKGSGMIEEVAYQIAFLHRPEYYGITEEEFGEENTKDLAYLIISKHRDGKLGRVKLRAILQCSKFTRWDSDYIPWIPVKKASVVSDSGNFDDGFEEAAPF